MEEVTVEQSASSRSVAVPRVSQSPARKRVREAATAGVLIKQLKQLKRAQAGNERAVPVVARVTKASRTREI
jgi:hypothetical protein